MVSRFYGQVSTELRVLVAAAERELESISIGGDFGGEIRNLGFFPSAFTHMS